MRKVNIVIPTIRENCIRDFLNVWKDEFANAEIILVEDNPTRTFNLGDHPNVTHYSWENIEEDLGSSAWIIPRRTDCVRSYGYFKAWQRQPDMIVTLDDDCYPMQPGGAGFLAKHWERLNATGAEDAWHESGYGVQTRGIPYYQIHRNWPVAINHGMWNRVPDYDAATQLLESRFPHSFGFDNQTIPAGKYFPMCGMNVALRPEAVPAFYFLMMCKNYEFDRFGDIWAGVFLKKICDHLGYAVNSGDPAVDHQRASNVFANLRKEAPGLEHNETLWRCVDSIILTKTTFRDCYREIADGIAAQLDSAKGFPEQKTGTQYFDTLTKAMRAWTDLFFPIAFEDGSPCAASLCATGGVL